jgi:ribonuclease BN (tRNA processing enzyme)
MNGSRLTVLGSCGGWPEPGRGCAGFLVEHLGASIAIDLGYDTASRLLGILGSAVGDGLDAVIVSHHHPDHMADLHALMRARWFGQRAAPAIPLFAPAGVLAMLVDLEDGDESAVRHVFDWRPIPAPRQRAGPFQLDSVTLPHYVPNAGVRLSAPGLTVAYTGDTGPDPALAELGRGCDLLIVDATTRNQQAAAPPAPPGPAMNLTDIEAGQAASAAGASRLLLTHFWPGNDRQASRQAAATAFSGDILLAAEGAVIPLP